MSSETYTEPTVVPATRVMGLGVGVFLIGFFVFVVAVVFLATSPCLVKPKIFFRFISVSMLGLVLFLLFSADRESEYENEGSMTTTYDESIVPRISIGLMMIFFSLFALYELSRSLFESKQIFNLDAGEHGER